MLEVKGLSTYFYLDEATVKAVDNVSFKLGNGEVLGLVGESGSGKSTVALSIMRLIAVPGKIEAGKILLDGVDLQKISEPEMIKVRGGSISMVFQDPFSSLNPVFSVGDQIAEAIRLHQRVGWAEAWKRAQAMLEEVKIKNGAERAHDYPHQFSGGMRQRVMIAMALACRPKILIADEPTTALDVTIQAEILDLLQDLQKRFGLSILYITHNFGIVKKLCDRAVVMHEGKLVEEGKIPELIDHPRQPYTIRLIDSLKALRR